MLVRRVLLVVPIVVLAVGGCAGDTSPTATGSVPSVSEPSLSASPLTPTSPGPSGSVPPEVISSPAVQAAVTDLADRLTVAPAEVEVVEVREVTWPDSSLGCPQPGMNYTQALVNGQLVVLSVGGRTYEYHSGPNRPLFYCASPKPPVAEGTGAGAH